MSERTHAPRSGGRSAEPQRPANGRREQGTSRDAETPKGAGRGARRSEEAEDSASRRSDTRRSGIRKTEGVRGKARDTEGVRPKARDSEGVRAKARDTDGVRAKARDSEGVRAKARPAAGVRGKARDAVTARDRTRVTAGRGKVDAPVDGAAALQIEAEPLRATDATTGPRLRVAPPPTIHGGPRAPFVASVIGLVIVGVLGILLINTETNANSFRIEDLKKQNTALENQRQDLDQQVVEASSIGNLDAAARRLGLVKARTEDVAQIRLPDGKIINFHGPATGKRSPTAQEGINEPSLDGTGR
ncbi:hypothetical protein [Actinoplanes solisilvae]|uniref:hypothetical protein n=1 Tax=Actinoplanes solisilvae TaxID=2486853 RepID=UPI000FDA761C|nr:hypothetical protein [Actinoplanes solisilvae]